MIKFCPNCTAELISNPDLAQGCKECKVCGGTYFQIETTRPFDQRKIYKSNKNHERGNKESPKLD